MKKYIIPILIIVVLIGIISFIYINKTSSYPDTTSNYQATQTATENEIQTNTSKQNNTTKISVPVIQEEIISSFTTKVSGTSARKNNISICSSSLNDTTISAGDTFSFWNTVGNTTKEKGYKKAKSFDNNGKTIKTYGGGVCQVSTTLYNAVLSVSDLQVLERHPHSKPVTYVEKDKDASVCYSSSDFKFKNNSTHAIKIRSTYDNNNLTIELIKLINS